MTDLELTKLCAEAMGGSLIVDSPRGRKGVSFIRLEGHIYDPLHNDDQAMALVKIWEMTLVHVGTWAAGIDMPDSSTHISRNDNLNRAICEAVATMQKARAKPVDTE